MTSPPLGPEKRPVGSEKHVFPVCFPKGRSPIGRRAILLSEASCRETSSDPCLENSRPQGCPSGGLRKLWRGLSIARTGPSARRCELVNAGAEGCRPPMRRAVRGHRQGPHAITTTARPALALGIAGCSFGPRCCQAGCCPLALSRRSLAPPAAWCVHSAPGTHCAASRAPARAAYAPVREAALLAARPTHPVMSFPERKTVGREEDGFPLRGFWSRCSFSKGFRV